MAKKTDIDPFGLLRLPYVHFGYVIAQVRKAIGFTQGEFGALLEGFSQPNVARYESGDTDPPLEFWRKFAKAFSLNLVWVFTGEGKPYLNECANEEARARVGKYIVAFVAHLPPHKINQVRSTFFRKPALMEYFRVPQEKFGDADDDVDQPISLDELFDTPTQDKSGELSDARRRKPRAPKKRGAKRPKPPSKNR